MAVKFEVFIDDEYWLGLKDPESSYKMIIEKSFSAGNSSGRISFKLPYPYKLGNLGSDDSHIGLTCRPLELYPERVRNLVIDSGKQYIEIGAGLGGFIPFHVVPNLDKILHRPIVIDLADYGLLEEFLNHAKEFDFDGDEGQYQSLVKSCLSACEIIRDSSKVRLINEPLDVALRNHLELIGSGDIVVDNCGPSHYPLSIKRRIEMLYPGSSKSIILQTEERLRDRVLQMERQLLKPDGQLFREY